MPLTSGKMAPDHDQKIRSNLCYLIENIDAKDLTARFIQEGIFDFSDEEEINGFNPNTASNRNGCFFKLLFSSGPRAYEVFLEALRANHLQNVIDRIEGTQVDPTEPVENDELRREDPDVPEVIHTSLSPSPVRDISAKEKILSNESLNALAAALSPQDANRLVVSLGIPDAIVKQVRRNHSHDVVEQQYELLKHWRHRDADNSTDGMYDTLLRELAALRRNDIKKAIEWVVQENRNITRQDIGL